MARERFVIMAPMVFIISTMLSLLLLPSAFGHKSPPESYDLEGTTMIRYTQKPLLPAVGDEVRFLIELIPRSEEPLEEAYSVRFTIYADESFTEWHDNLAHEHEQKVILGEYSGEEVRSYLYEASHIFETPRTYHVEVQVEHDGQTLSEQHQMVLVEPRSPGPLFWGWLIVMLIGVLLGAKREVW